MVMKSLFKGTIKQSVIEIILIVVGVLIALGVDDWRSNVIEKKSVQQHLLGIVGEIDSNLWTLHRIRDGLVSNQVASLEEVLRVLSEAEPQINDPEDFINVLMTSAKGASPWLSQNSFGAFRSSEDYHSIYVQGLAGDISSTYDALNTLYYQRFEIADPYKDAVSEIVPARYQSESNQLRGYAPGRFSAPVIADEEPLEQTIAAIIENRQQLVQLARYKAERITAKWYAMTRIILQFQDLKDSILDHQVMQDVDIPESELTAEVEGQRI